MDGRSLRDFFPSLSECEQSILGIAFAGTDSHTPQSKLSPRFVRFRSLVRRIAIFACGLGGQANERNETCFELNG
jgi:hypothetical protein